MYDLIAEHENAKYTGFKSLLAAKEYAIFLGVSPKTWQLTEGGTDYVANLSELGETYFLRYYDQPFKAKVRSFMSGKFDEWFIMSLIIISLVMLPIETLQSLTPQQLDWLHTLDKIIVVIFTLEYAVRFYLDGWKFSKSAGGIIDFLAIAPYYLALGAGFQSIRAFRLFRLVRILKLLRYTKALDRMIAAFKIARDELLMFGFMTLSILYLVAVGIYHFEHAAQPENFKNIFDSLWWSVVTLTTIGYGDIYPVTIGGRVLTMMVALIALGIVAIPTSVLSSALTEVRNQERGEC